MLGIGEAYTPQEAWDELRARRRDYYDPYNAAFSGKHSDLKRTAECGTFWRRKGQAKVHVPVAADIASMAGNLVFGEEPAFSVYDKSKGEAEDGSHDRLDEIVSGNGLVQKLHEAAELASAAGDVYIKARYDKKGADMPIIEIVRGQDALPEYSLGKLMCVHFFTVYWIDRKSGKTWRVYERYEAGKIITAVYCGRTDDLGQEDSSAMAELGLEPEITTPVDAILAAHVVNMRPSRTWQTEDKGRSDFEGLRDMLDSLDEIYSSWIRDIRLAKSRLIVPAEFLRRKPEDIINGRTYSYEFDQDVETFVALDIINDHEMKITPSQFQIRAEEHAQTFENTLRTIISEAGYSPQTFGMDVQGNAQSGTARRIMERKSLATTAKKQAYWRGPLGTFLTAVMQLDKALYGNANWHDDDVVLVETRDPYISDPAELASAVNMLRSAQAASTDTLVRMLHADWKDGEIEEEVRLIQQEHGIDTGRTDLDAGDGENQ